MARPRRPIEERGLIERAAQELGATGSRRAQAAAVAEAVACLATAQITLDELDAVMAKGAAVFSTPALATLAFADDAVAAEMVVAEATAAFQRHGCRHPDGAARRAFDEGVRSAVAARLSERFRRR